MAESKSSAAKPMSKSQVYAALSEKAELSKKQIDAVTRFYVDTNLFVAVVECRRSNCGCSRGAETRKEAPAIELDNRAPHQRVCRHRVGTVGLPIDQQHLCAGPRQQQSCGSTCTACADDDCVVACVETLERVHCRNSQAAARARLWLR